MRISIEKWKRIRYNKKETVRGGGFVREELVLSLGEAEIRFFFERKRVKRLNLRVKRDGSVFVSAPVSTPIATVFDFVRGNACFILRAKRAMSELPPTPPPLGEGSVVYYLGDAYRLTLVRGKNSLTFRDGRAILALPRAGTDVARAYRARIAEHFLPIITEMCEEMEARFPHLAGRRREIRVRYMTSMWGNCRPKEGRLTFSTALAEMPRALILGVVAHEYAHFLVPGHSERFYAALARISPDHKALAEALTRRKKEILKGQ